MLAAKKGEIRKAGTELHGQLAGEYRIVHKLGSGGFGTVYEAEHPLLKRRAAVKVLHAHPAMDSTAVQRFISEARAASQIRHRNIVDIFSFGTLPNGQYFYVMDLLEGAPLDRYLRDQGRIAPEVALPLLRTVASAIDALHAASIVHRDLKPGNIFLSWEASGEVVPKLLDFGLVKLLSNPLVHTAQGVPMGTPYYMSPEQCQGHAVDARADVYSFGVICHELLTGKVPFSGDSATALLMAHVLQTPPRMSVEVPDLSPDLDEPVLRMLAKDPAERPGSAGEAVRELEKAARLLGVSIAERVPWLPRPLSADATLPAPDELLPDQSGMRDGTQEVTAQGGSRRWLWAAVGLCLLLAAAGAMTLGRRDPAPAIVPSLPQQPSAAETIPPPPPSAADAPSAPDLEPPPAAAAPEPARKVTLTLRGAPANATVALGDQQLGAANAPIELPYGSEPLRLTINAPGAPPRTISVTPDGPVELTLPPRSKKKSVLPTDLENPF